MVFLRLLQPLGIDFIQFYEASLMWLHGLNPYTRLLSSPGPFNYPPTAILFLWWPGLFNLVTAAIIWNLISLAAFLLSLYLLLKLVYSHRFSWLLYALFAIAFTLPFFPLKYTLDSGQINNVILLGIVLTLWFDVHDHLWLSALALMLATLIKITPAIFIFAYISSRRYQQLLRLTLLGSLMATVPFIVFPLQDLSVYFFKVFHQPFTLAGKAVYYNQSLLGLLTRQISLSQVIPIFMIIALVVAIVSWNYLRSASSLGAFALLSCLLLLFSPISWQHHFVFSLVPLVYLSARLSLRWWGLGYALIALNLASPLNVPAPLSILISHQTLGVFYGWLLLVVIPTQSHIVTNHSI